jgi:hypothetical protein
MSGYGFDFGFIPDSGTQITCGFWVECGFYTHTHIQNPKNFYTQTQNPKFFWVCIFFYSNFSKNKIFEIQKFLGLKISDFFEIS